jgi:hypothetical protein
MTERRPHHAGRLAGTVAFLTLLLMAEGVTALDDPLVLEVDDGYRGIWYSNERTGDEYVYKYSGGMATYPQQHLPIACYAPEANKTFFVYGGTLQDKQQLLHMISYFDHATQTLPRPRILLDKQTTDAHDNPTLNIDRTGHLWIFSNSHGTSRPSLIHRGTKPYSIDSFQRVQTTNFSYSQPWVLADGRFVLMHTRYQSGHRVMFWMTSPDGSTWDEPRPLAHVEQGHYQVSWCDGHRVATVFNYHPRRGGLNARTNLYYLESPDAGQTWQTVDGKVIHTPLVHIENPALVEDYRGRGLLVYLKTLQFDADGRPIVLYLTSRGHEPGPVNDPRMWHIARWTGKRWEIRDVTTSDHNYDFGSLYLEDDGTWRLIAPTDPGAQPFGTGGQMVMWASDNQGQSWRRIKQLTRDARYNHSYARRPLSARDDFYAIWADGDTRAPSDSSLYYTNRSGTHVWRLPRKMATDTARPEVAW